MSFVRSSFERVTLFTPEIRAGATALEVATCLSRAFSSGSWATSPMPIGSHDDSNSALGIVNGLGARPVNLAARAIVADGSSKGAVVGCVLGAILDDEVIARYGLASFSAASGDALLAFIGIVPEAQRIRVSGRGGGTSKVVPPGRRRRSISLARHLFESWLGRTSVQNCPQIFIRTREQIAPVLHLCSDNGFAYCGRFDLHFRGTVQERLVFRRSTAAPGIGGTRSATPRGRRGT
jgi:hypothetical protein